MNLSTKRLLACFMFVVVSFVASFGTVSAATYYVAGDVGSDAYSSVQAQNTATPWATIQKVAGTALAPGDIVNVKGGLTYNETVTPSTSGSSGGGYITYQAWSGTGIPIITIPLNSNGFYISSKNYIVISGFEITGSVTSDNGIYCMLANNITVKNNIIHNIHKSGWGIGIYAKRVAYNRFYNNTFYDHDYAIHFEFTVENNYNEVKSNIAFAGLYGLSFNSASIDSDYNIVYNHSIDNYSAASIGAHDISLDPLFVDPANGDFSLQPNSPAINMGADLTASGVTTDILGRTRPNAGAFDIGAYEDPNLYVDGNDGNDANNGALETPFKTIQKGADVSTPGDNVNIKGNTIYSGAGTSNCGGSGLSSLVCHNTSGTATLPIKYQAWPENGVPTIDGIGKKAGFGISGKFVQVSGLHIKDVSGIPGYGVVTLN